MINIEMNWLQLVQRSGYGIVPGILTHNEISSLEDELSQEGLHRSRAGVRHVMCLPAVSRIANSESVMSIVRAVLGKDAVPFRATFFDKSSSSNWLVMWHQDTALPLLEKRETEGWGPWSVKDGVTYAHAPTGALEQVLAVRLHLDDSDLDNGPLRVLPGTHASGLLTDEQMHQLSESVAAVNCTVPRGGVVLMRPLLVHASSKSTSDNPRRVVHIEYANHREILPKMNLAIA